jgi:hypothetical protein
MISYAEGETDRNDCTLGCGEFVPLGTHKSLWRFFVRLRRTWNIDRNF